MLTLYLLVLFKLVPQLRDPSARLLGFDDEDEDDDLMETSEVRVCVHVHVHACLALWTEMIIVLFYCRLL